MVFPARKAIIMVNGCFWHGHGCKRGARKPKSNSEYWASKIGRNVERDQAIRCQLEAQGWRVLIVWECDIANEELLAQRLQGFLEKSPLG